MGCGGDGGAFRSWVRCQAYCQGSSAHVCLLMHERGAILALSVLLLLAHVFDAVVVSVSCAVHAAELGVMPNNQPRF